MKKIFIGLVMIALSSCSYYMKGDYTLGKRNTFNDFFYTYNIRYYDTDSMSEVVTENVTVSDYETNVVRHAVPGGMVVSSKILAKQIYSNEVVRPNKKGALVSYTVPVEFSDEEVYKVIGEVEIDKKIYRLLEPNRLGDIVLLTEQGDIYPRVGRIYNDRLALLKTSFLPEPRDIKFVNEFENQSGDENVVSGYEIRYMGIEDYRMVFKYNRVSPNGGHPIEQMQTYKFPMYDKLVEIEGIRLEILEVNSSGIEYKIVP